MSFKTIPHQSRVDHLKIDHIIQINGFCPATKNPQQGSTLRITYRPNNAVLDTTHLKLHVDSFKGGAWVDGLHIRNLETLVEQIAIDACAVLDVIVEVAIIGYLKAGQTIDITTIKTPSWMKQ